MPALRIVIALLVLGGAAFWLLRRPSPVAGASPAARVEAAIPATEEAYVRQEPISPIPQNLPLDPARVALGRKLFHDPRLSKDNSISCASCHPLARAGTDHLVRSIGIHGTVGRVNAPTVFNTGFNFRQFWDGRADTLEDQMEGPMLSAIEMGSTWDETLGKLRQDPAYAAEFKAAFADGLQSRNVRVAIAEFERSLSTPDARFDRYLRGDSTALTDAERAGYAKFKSYGCVSCHQGVNIGANMFQRMGIIRDYFADRGGITEADYGRFNVTRNDADRFFFKVPSLRNVAVTAPYFHDGSAATLEEAVAVMAKYQLGRPLPPEDLADIVRFLHALTGEFEGKPLGP
jgi:cytochrome c peroxidase